MAACLALAFVAASWLRAWASPRPAVPAVAVAEFRDLAGSAWLATAIPEMLAGVLAAEGDLRVTDVDDADYVLSGSFLSVGEGEERRLRVNLWADGAASFSRQETADERQLFELVTRTAAAVRRELGLPEVSGPAIPSMPRPTPRSPKCCAGSARPSWRRRAPAVATSCASRRVSPGLERPNRTVVDSATPSGLTSRRLSHQASPQRPKKPGTPARQAHMARTNLELA